MNVQAINNTEKTSKRSNPEVSHATLLVQRIYAQFELLEELTQRKSFMVKEISAVLGAKKKNL